MARKIFIPNPFKYNSQNFRVLERVKKGPVTNVEVVHDMKILNSTGRFSDCRKYVRGFGCDIKSIPDEPGKGGIFTYKLIGI